MMELLCHIVISEDKNASVGMPSNTPNTEYGTERTDWDGGSRNTVTPMLNPLIQRVERSSVVAGTHSNDHTYIGI